MTRADLIKRVLQKLRELEFDEGPSSDESAIIGAKYDEVYAELNERGLVNWSASGEVPLTHSQSVIAIVASRSSDDFFVDEPRLQRLVFEERTAEKKLRQMEHIPYVSTDEPVYY